MRISDWSSDVCSSDLTLVIYMGLATALAIADKLIADGVSPGLPVAVVERGTTAEARVLRTLLHDPGDLVAPQRGPRHALNVGATDAAQADWNADQTGQGQRVPAVEV